MDWSGRRTGEQRYLWTAEAAGNRLIGLANGRCRPQVESHLVSLAAREPRLVVGLDFSFSLPAWWLAGEGIADVSELWRAAAESGETWLAECRPPFWGRPSRRRPVVDETAHPSLRLTEQLVPPVGGLRPKSTFQVGGAGSPGTGSIRGMPMLARLRQAGFRIWPFDPPGWPVVLEIWPRLLTGPVRKSKAPARRRYLEALAATFRAWCADPCLAERAASSEDAFDAAVSALALGRLRSLDDLPSPLPAQARLEGWIWAPPPRAVGVTLVDGNRSGGGATLAAAKAQTGSSVEATAKGSR